MSVSHKILHKGGFPCLEITLQKGESVMAERGAMMSMSPHISLSPQWKGSARRFLTEESLFINQFTAHKDDGQVVLGGKFAGGIQHIPLEETGEVLVQSGGFLASTPLVVLDKQWHGLFRGFFSGAGLFLILCRGRGDLFLSSFGGILPIDVKGEYVVDTGHVMAFSKNLKHSVTKVGGYKSFFFSGEGLVVRFTGEGRVWVQTYHSGAFAGLADSYRPNIRVRIR